MNKLYRSFWLAVAAVSAFFCSSCSRVDYPGVETGVLLVKDGKSVWVHYTDGPKKSAKASSNFFSIMEMLVDSGFADAKYLGGVSIPSPSASIKTDYIDSVIAKEVIRIDKTRKGSDYESIIFEYRNINLRRGLMESLNEIFLEEENIVLCKDGLRHCIWVFPVFSSLNFSDADDGAPVVYNGDYVISITADTGKLSREFFSRLKARGDGGIFKERVRLEGPVNNDNASLSIQALLYRKIFISGVTMTVEDLNGKRAVINDPKGNIVNRALFPIDSATSNN